MMTEARFSRPLPGLVAEAARRNPFIVPEKIDGTILAPIVSAASERAPGASRRRFAGREAA